MDKDLIIYGHNFNHHFHSATLAAVPVGSSLAASKEQKWALLAHSSPLAARAAAAVAIQSPPVRRRRRLRRFSLPLVQ